MGDRFDQFIAAVLDHEGPRESPGDEKTRWGVIQADVDAMHRLGLWQEWRGLDQITNDQAGRERAAEVFRALYWAEAGMDRLTDDGIAAKLLDMAVLMGIERAVQCLQWALRSVGSTVADDGDLGPLTVVALNAAPAWAGLLAAFRSECAGRLRGWKDPTGSLGGWLDRAYE
jgi:lysozyme family protein